MIEEEWREIEGFPLYEVSNLGRVRSWNGNRRGRSGRRATPLLMRQCRRRYGHMTVYLSRNGEGNTFTVHRLVVRAFIGPIPNGMHACHNDGNASNNHVSNLRIDTPLGNARDTVLHGTAAFGQKNPNSTLSPELVREIRRLGPSMTRTAIAKQLGVGRVAVGDVLLGKTWGWLQ